MLKSNNFQYYKLHVITTRGVYKVCYHEIPQEELWRVDLINETVDTLWGENTVEGFTREELSFILGYACAS